MSSEGELLSHPPPAASDSEIQNPVRWRKPLLIAGVFAVIVVIILSALPYVVAHFATRWLVDHGASTAHIEDVNINLFTGVVGVSGLDASDGQQAQLRIESAEVGIHWWPLAKQRIHIEYLRLAGGTIDVVAGEQGVVQIGAVTLDLSSPDAADQSVEVSVADSPVWGFGSELVVIENVQLNYSDSLFATTVEARELRIGSHFSWEAGRTTDVLVDVSIDGAPLVLRSDVSPWGEQREFSGALQLEDFELSNHRQALSELAGFEDPRGALNFDLQLDVLHTDDGTLELKVNGPLQLQDVAFDLGGLAVTNSDFTWQGSISLDLPARQDRNMLLLDGSLSLADARVVGISKDFEIQLATFDWRGSLGFSPPAVPEAAGKANSLGSIAGTGFTVDHPALPFQLVELQKFAVDELQVRDPSEVSAARFSVQQLRLLEDEVQSEALSHVFSLAQLDLDTFEYKAGSGVSAQKLTFLQPKAVVTRNSTGQFRRIQEVLDLFGAEQQPDETHSEEKKSEEKQPEEPKSEERGADETAPPIRFAADKIELRSDSLLRFEDQAVAPTVVLKLGETQLDISGIDSSGGRPMDLRLVAEDGAMQLNAEGQLNPFAASTSAAMKVDLDGLDLTQLTAYVPDFNIERGRLSADSQLAVDDGKLDARNDLTIDRLKLSGKAEDRHAPGSQGMAMPVDVALNLLRDGEDRIRLQLPVAGSLADPEFGTGDIIRQATQKALQKAAMSYVKNALQPLGTLMLVGDLAAKAARPRFEPVVMQAGQAALTAVGRDYLIKLGALLRERPSLPLTVCGVATPADKQALQAQAALDAPENMTELPTDKSVNEADAQAAPGSVTEPFEVTDAQLISLASLRTSMVINFLVEQHGIERSRLYTCRETIESMDEQPPRVEISL